jgi:hypothetical protein
MHSHPLAFATTHCGAQEKGRSYRPALQSVLHDRDAIVTRS